MLRVFSYASDFINACENGRYITSKMYWIQFFVWAMFNIFDVSEVVFTVFFMWSDSVILTNVFLLICIFYNWRAFENRLLREFRILNPVWLLYRNIMSGRLRELKALCFKAGWVLGGSANFESNWSFPFVFRNAVSFFLIEHTKLVSLSAKPQTCNWKIFSSNFG